MSVNGHIAQNPVLDPKPLIISTPAVLPKQVVSIIELPMPNNMGVGNIIYHLQCLKVKM